MKVKLLPWQLKVAKDSHRFRIVCAGRRAGKSVLSRMIILRWAGEQQGLYWIVSPTYKQSKMIHWRDMQKEIPPEWVKSKNEVELSFTLKNGSIIELKGSENPDALRGVKLRGLVIDEIASIRNWEWLWSEVLRPTLTDYEAPAIFISTPKGFNHFYELYQAGQAGDSLYKSWRFSSYKNRTLPKGELDDAKKELTEDTFAQEYMADFRKYTGLVFKEFEREKHVIKPIEVLDTWQLYRAFDFGTTNPFVCLWIAVASNDTWYIVAEYYQSGQTTEQRAGIINANPLSNRVTASFGDPAGAQEIMDLGTKGIYITPATREIGTNASSWVRAGIEKVSEKLKILPGKKPQLYVFNNCVNTIREFETYRWKEKTESQAQDLNEPDVPEKANDHAMDALRYFAVSIGKKQEQYIRPKKNWSIA